MKTQNMFSDAKTDDTKKNIIFLDIDGVLQPYKNQDRFDHNMEDTVEFLCKKYNTDIYKKMDKYDVTAAFYDWDETAIGFLKKLIYETNSYIVFHTGWCEYNSFDKMVALMALYDIDNVCLDSCETGISKEEKIKRYLKAHKDEIENYVILDDENFSYHFGYHFICTKDFLKENQYELAKFILTNDFKFKKEDNDIKLIIKNENNKDFFINLNYKKINIEEGTVFKINIHDNFSLYNSFQKIALIKYVQGLFFKKGFGMFIETYSDDELVSLLKNSFCGVTLGHNKGNNYKRIFIPTDTNVNFLELYRKYEEKIFEN